MKTGDPARMSHSERLDEIAELLARGAQRYFAQERKAPVETRNSQVRLDALAAAEAQCGSHALNPKSPAA